MKSIKCACGKRTALVEKNPRDVKDVYTLIDSRWVSQSKQNTHMMKKDFESHGLLYRDARVSSGKLVMSRSMSDQNSDTDFEENGANDTKAGTTSESGDSSFEVFDVGDLRDIVINKVNSTAALTGQQQMPLKYSNNTDDGVDGEHSPSGGEIPNSNQEFLENNKSSGGSGQKSNQLSVSKN